MQYPLGTNSFQTNGTPIPIDEFTTLANKFVNTNDKLQHALPSTIIRKRYYNYMFFTCAISYSPRLRLCHTMKFNQSRVFLLNFKYRAVYTRETMWASPPVIWSSIRSMEMNTTNMLMRCLKWTAGNSFTIFYVPRQTRKLCFDGKSGKYFGDIIYDFFELGNSFELPWLPHDHKVY